jgi:hypothetical protein
VRLQDRTVTCTDRNVGRARLRTAPLDGRELLRRCLPQVVPDGCVQVRPCGLLHASGAVPLATSRLLMAPGHPSEDQPTQRTPSPPRVACCPTCGTPMCVVMRLWTSPRALVDTG